VAPTLDNADQLFTKVKHQVPRFLQYVEVADQDPSSGSLWITLM